MQEPILLLNQDPSAQIVPVGPALYVLFENRKVIPHRINPVLNRQQIRL